MWPVVKALRNVFCSSIASRSRRVMKSARPTPIALPCEASASERAAITWIRGLGEVFAVADAAVADHVRVHAGAAVRLADRVDHQHVDVVERQAREVVAVPLEELRLAGEDFGRARRRAARPSGRSRLRGSRGRPRSCPSRARPGPFRSSMSFIVRRGGGVERRRPTGFCPCRRPSSS